MSRVKLLDQSSSLCAPRALEHYSATRRSLHATSLAPTAHPPFTRSPCLPRCSYPRLTLENRVYCSRVFRKLHVEVGVRQDGLHVLHVVLYPRYK